MQTVLHCKQKRFSYFCFYSRGRLQIEMEALSKCSEKWPHRFKSVQQFGMTSDLNLETSLLRLRPAIVFSSKPGVSTADERSIGWLQLKAVVSLWKKHFWLNIVLHWQIGYLHCPAVVWLHIRARVVISSKQKSNSTMLLMQIPQYHLYDTYALLIKQWMREQIKKVGFVFFDYSVYYSWRTNSDKRLPF